MGENVTLEEKPFIEKLRWDRLHQRVDQLEKLYDATIVVKRSNGLPMPQRPIQNGKQTIDDLTITLTRIYKSVYWMNPKEPTFSGIVAGDSEGINLYHTGEKLIVHLLVESSNPTMIPRKRLYIEDDLGNRLKSGGGGSLDNGELASEFVYVPQAASFTLRCEVVNCAESDCDALLFTDVPIDGNGISQTFGDEIITYNGIHHHETENRYYIHLVHNKAREVRHVGVAAGLIDNLGNRYSANGGGSWGYDEKEGLFFENFKVPAPNPKAKSITFKYLFARTLLVFEWRDLPLPS